MSLKQAQVWISDPSSFLIRAAIPLKTRTAHFSMLLTGAAASEGSHLGIRIRCRFLARVTLHVFLSRIGSVGPDPQHTAQRADSGCCIYRKFLQEDLGCVVRVRIANSVPPATPPPPGPSVPTA